MGVVYRATHAMLRRPAAIKLLLKDRARASDSRASSARCSCTSRFAHPNTVSIFDYGRTSEGVFYYVDGAPRRDGPRTLVEQRRADRAPRAIHILAQVAAPSRKRTRSASIHRDIKPANIVLTERADEPDVVKVVDFGLVKTMEEPATLRFNARCSPARPCTSHPKP